MIIASEWQAGPTGQQQQAEPPSVRCALQRAWNRSLSSRPSRTEMNVAYASLVSPALMAERAATVALAHRLTAHGLCCSPIL